VIAWRADAPSGDELTVWSARKLERHFEDHHDGRLQRTKKCRSVANLEITSVPALQGSVSSFLDLVLISAAYAAFLFPGTTSWVPLLSLYILLGFPSEVAFSALSLDKFHNYSNHYRQWIGCSFNTKDLTVGIMPSKRVELLSHLKNWINMNSYTLLEVARMLGLLEFHTKYTLWVTPRKPTIHNPSGSQF
jgi:hypothetical protein